MDDDLGLSSSRDVATWATRAVQRGAWSIGFKTEYQVAQAIHTSDDMPYAQERRHATYCADELSIFCESFVLNQGLATWLSDASKVHLIPPIKLSQNRSFAFGRGKVQK